MIRIYHYMTRISSFFSPPRINLVRWWVKNVKKKYTSNLEYYFTVIYPQNYLYYSHLKFCYITSDYLKKRMTINMMICHLEFVAIKPTGLFFILTGVLSSARFLLVDLGYKGQERKQSQDLSEGMISWNSDKIQNGLLFLCSPPYYFSFVYSWPISDIASKPNHPLGTIQNQIQGNTNQVIIQTI